MKIDMHCHTSERSHCCIVTECQQIESAIKYGLGGIVITDHNKNVPKEHLADLNKKYAPFKIFSGIEITIKDNSEDVLVIGIHENILEQKKWRYDELYKFIREKEGFITLAHPYRYSNDIKINIDEYIPDAIEIHSTNIGHCDEALIRQTANRLGARLVANSDAHNNIHIGIYHNDFFEDIESDKDLIRELKAGRYKIGYDIERIDIYNKEVKKREDIIKKMIKDGASANDYQNITGNWIGQFNRVLLEKSYEI